MPKVEGKYKLTDDYMIILNVNNNNIIIIVNNKG